jgi:hypothetical protein
MSGPVLISDTSNQPVTRPDLRKSLGPNPRLVKAFEDMQADGGKTVQFLNQLITRFFNSNPGAFQARLFADIRAIKWADLGLDVPDSIRTSGYTVLGKGGATYFKLGPGTWTENAYTISDGEGNFWQLPFDQPVEAEQLGAIGDASYSGTSRSGTDDTVAWNLAVSGLWYHVKANPRAYLISGLGIMPAPGVTVFGWAGEGYVDNTNPANPRILPTFIGDVGCTAVFNFGYLRDSGGLPINVRSVSLIGIHIDGVDQTFPAVSGGSNHLKFYGSTSLNCSSGIGEAALGPDGTHGSNYTHALKWLDSSANSCGVGIQNLVDGQVLGGSVANCQTYGIHGTTGANANTFIGIRVEFTQAGPNFGFYQCEDIIVADLCSDRAFTNSVDIRQCKQIQVANVKHRRPGKSGDPIDVGLYIEDSQSITATNNDFSSGHDDGGTPPDTPTSAIVINNTSNPSYPVTDITIDGGQASTIPTPLQCFPLRDSIPNLVVVNLAGVLNYDNRSLLKQKDGRLYYAPTPDTQSTELNPGDSFSWTFRLPAISATTTEGYTLTVTTRWKTSPANRNHAKFGLFAYQEAIPSANIISTPVFSEYGTPGAVAFGTGTVVNLAISAVDASDASSFTLTGTNTDASHVIQVQVRLTPP